MSACRIVRRIFAKCALNEAEMTPCFEETFGFLGAGESGETGCSVRYKKRSMIEDPIMVTSSK